MDTRDALFAELAAAGLPQPLVLHARADAIPAVPGAYVLLLGLAQEIELDMARFAGVRLAPGDYLYAGSARGPGGLRARIARHLRPDKKLHWHIDRLAARATVAALAFPGAAECGLVAMLAERPGFSAPVPGFGSSDCRTCASHLWQWAGGGTRR